MRYEPIDNIVFTDNRGTATEIKDMREYPDYQLLASVKVMIEDSIDEIASRDEFYGIDAEGDSYKIIDFNLVKLYENDFGLSKIKRLQIPI